MSSHSRRALVALGFAAFGLASAGCHKPAAGPAKSWYDAAPLLESLRPEERAGAAGAVGAKALNDLPLYDLDIRLGDDLTRLHLDEDLYFTNGHGVALDEVVLRIYANAVEGEPRVKLAKGSCSDGPSCSVSQTAPSVIVAKLAKPLAPGARVRVKMSFDGTLEAIEPSRTSMLAQSFESLDRIKTGKGGGDYGLLAKGDEIASLASFYAVVARFRNGAWEKADKSTLGDLGADGVSHVRAHVRVPADAHVVSSGIEVGTPKTTSTDAGAESESEIVAALVRDFSLLVSRRFESESKSVAGVVVRSHFLGRDRDAGKKVLAAAAASLESYQRLFGRYPFVDLDVVEAPLVGGAGGVEFSGLVTVASMLYHPALSEGPLGALAGLLGGPNQKALDEMTDSMLEFVTAHEVAHQYWPGLVGSDARQHPFMDESLAQWSAVLYFRDRYGPERAKLEAEREVLANYHMMRLMGEADAPVDRPVDAFSSELSYAGLVYGKGPFLFREIEKKVGKDAFLAGLQSYAKKHRFENAPPRALVDELAKGDQAESVRTLVHRWLDESHGDDDLGQPDVRKLIAGWIGEDAAKAMGPELDMAMKLVLKLLGPGGGKADDPTDLLKELLGGSKNK